MAGGTLGNRRLPIADGQVVVYTAPAAGPGVDHVLVDVNVVNISGEDGSTLGDVKFSLLVGTTYVEYKTLLKQDQGIFRALGVVSPGDIVHAKVESGGLVDIRLSGIVVPPLV